MASEVGEQYSPAPEVKCLAPLSATRVVVFRLDIPYYRFYIWPTFYYHYIQFSITSDMTNEELRSEVCRGFNKDRNSKVRVYKLCCVPKHRDVTHISQYMPEITDVSEYLDNEVYIVEFY